MISFVLLIARAAGLLAALLLLRPGTAHAGYLDPGSGSTLVQGIIAAVAACRRVWHSLLRALGLRRAK